MIDEFLTRVASTRLFLGKLWMLTRPYWFAREHGSCRLFGHSVSFRESWLAFGLLTLIVALSLFIVYLTKLLNDWNARFFNALQARNADAFWYELKYWIVLVAILLVGFVYRLWLTQLLTIRWRRWLSEVYFRDWLADRTFYRMELVSQGTDNPEQRIEQDIATFASQTLSIAVGLLLQVLMLVTFAVILWKLSGNYVLPILGGLAIPGYMMWAALIYALVGSYATYLVGRPLVRVNFELERRNADFRYRMVRIRENAESIALYRGEPNEESRLRSAFAGIYQVWWRYMKFTKRLTWLSSFYAQAAAVFPIVVAAPRYFAGVIPLGVLTQTVNAFGQVQGPLSWFVDTYATLAAWKAVVDRLTTFSEAMVTAKEAAAADAFDVRVDGPRLGLEHVDIRLPTGEPLMQGIFLNVNRGERVVLFGPSGTGKTTLFRVLAGLWPYGRGHIVLPQSNRVLFLPQKPYLPTGTLKEILSYPQLPDQHGDDSYREVLRACLLGHCAARLAECTNWSLVLSGGEQQRLAFARALLYRPDWLFLDEATSALDEQTEQRMYELLIQSLPGTAIISNAHKSSVLLLHDRQVAVGPCLTQVFEQDDRGSGDALIKGPKLNGVNTPYGPEQSGPLPSHGQATAESHEHNY
jgi:putative ATP-binding cassette transporter